MEIVDVETIPVEIPVQDTSAELGIGPYVAGPRLAGLPTTMGWRNCYNIQ